MQFVVFHIPFLLGCGYGIMFLVDGEKKGVQIVELEGESKVKVVAMKDVDAGNLKEQVEKILMKKIELISQPPNKDEQKKDNKDSAKTLLLITLKRFLKDGGINTLI